MINEIKFSGGQTNYYPEVFKSAETSGFCLDRLDNGIETFKDSIVYPGSFPLKDAIPMRLDCLRNLYYRFKMAVSSPEIPFIKQ